MKVTLALALGPHEVIEWTIELPADADLAQALNSAPWRGRVSNEVAASLQCSIWGRAAPADTTLREGDRIELTRPLRVDPKVARRERFNAQGKRTAGLFARRRP